MKGTAWPVVVAVLLSVLGLGPALAAQEYTWQKVDSANVEVRVHKKLQGVPVELGKEGNVIELHRRARYDPRERQSIMKGPQPFKWGMDVYEFPEEKKYKDKPTDQNEIRRRAIEKRKYDAGARNFEHFVTSKDPRNSQAVWHGRKGKKFVEVKAKGKTPAHRYWEWSIEDSIADQNLDFRWYSVAASYRLEGREVALVFTWPVFKKKPDSKYLKIGKKMVQALKVLESKTANAAASGGKGGAIDPKDPRAEFAKSKERLEKLQTAVANIAGIDGWDFFTTPTAIVLYSWKPGSNKGDKARGEAETLAEHMNALPALYAQHFPKNDKTPEFFPVLRLCYNRTLFRNYGRPALRAEGLYSPDSDEIVVQLGGDYEPEHLIAHYGWHAYATNLFRTSKLAPWFSSGFGDFFAAHARRGDKWSVAPLKARIAGPKGAKKLFKAGAAASITEVLRWNEKKLAPEEDNEEAEQWIAQTYVVADFLVRGEKLGSKWDESWSKLLPSYTAQFAKTRNASRSAKVFASVNSSAFDEACAAWAASGLSKK